MSGFAHPLIGLRGVDTNTKLLRLRDTQLDFFLYRPTHTSMSVDAHTHTSTHRPLRASFTLGLPSAPPVTEAGHSGEKGGLRKKAREERERCFTVWEGKEGGGEEAPAGKTFGSQLFYVCFCSCLKSVCQVKVALSHIRFGPRSRIRWYGAMDWQKFP